MKNKIIPIILLMLVFFTFVMSTSVFAETYIPSLPSNYGNVIKVETSSFLDTFQYRYFIYIKDSSQNRDVYYYIFSNDKFAVNTDFSQRLYFEDGISHSVYVKNIIISSKSFYDTTVPNGVCDLTNINSNNTYVPSGSYINLYGGDGIFVDTCKIIGNADILNLKDNSVFLTAPHQEEQGSLMGISMDFSMVLAEILAILPIILVVVIGLLALRKAIQLLLTMLHQE